MQTIITADGSHTLFVPELNEHYHSVNGAVQESRHVYIESGFNQCKKENISVLEIGFGTGLNALLTCLEAEKKNIFTTYTSLEKYPLSPEITTTLNYSSINQTLFQQIHAAPWSERTILSSFFSLQKIETDICAYSFPGDFDVVFYDAFAPDKQPEVWSQKIFDNIFTGLNTGGILTTYCAKGEIRRILERSGFFVERIPGPPGKREMLRGQKLL